MNLTELNSTDLPKKFSIFGSSKIINILIKQTETSFFVKHNNFLDLDLKNINLVDPEEIDVDSLVQQIDSCRTFKLYELQDTDESTLVLIRLEK